MSFIIKGLNGGQSLRVGEILDDMLYTEVTLMKSWFDANIAGTTAASWYQEANRDGTIRAVQVSRETEEECNRRYRGTTLTTALERSRRMKDLMNNLWGVANQLYMPNMYYDFGSLGLAQNSYQFECGITLNTNTGGGTLVSTNQGSHSLPFSYTSDFVGSRDLCLKYDGFWGIGFKYWGDVERTLNDVRNGAWVAVSRYPQVYGTGTSGEFKSKDYMLFIFGTYSKGSSDPNLYQFFNSPNLTPENVEHLNDLPDDQNTYPGGGDDKNPYPDDESDPSGKGDFDNTNDPIDFPTLPIWDVQSTGFISIWNPTISQLQDLYLWLWNSNGSYWEAFTTTLSKMFSNPMEAIFSLGLIPVDPDTSGGMRTVTIGHIDTGIQMLSVQKQFATFDFGSVDCTEYYGAAWDYSPYTKASIYLPYIGVMDIDIDDVMNCILTLRYNIDIVTGTVVALLKCKRKGRDNLDAVMYEWQGNCLTQCPITASDWSQKMASVLQLGAMTGLALMQPRAGNSSQNGEENESQETVRRQLVSPSQYLNSALNVITSKVHVQRGGRLDLSAGAMSMQSAFLILNRPVSAIPRGWNDYSGYPSLKVKPLRTQKGFTKISAIKLNGLRATSEEIQELDTILKSGIIL